MNEHARRLALLLILTASVSMPARQGPSHKSGGQDAGAAWPELLQGLEKMHDEIRSIRSSSNNDVDFVRLMLPHHQAAIDMAKTELLYGKDPQMRRLAQEILTDQQSETELMQLWLKQRHFSSGNPTQTPASPASREH
jgi:uncharacterized protein (DUF305 family)